MVGAHFSAKVQIERLPAKIMNANSPPPDSTLNPETSSNPP